MTLLSASAIYHAGVRQRLRGMGRALALQRVTVWGSRGLAAGLILDLAIISAAWARGTTQTLPIPALGSLTVGLILAAIAASLVLRRLRPLDVAARVDRAAGLQERSLTALELGGRGGEHPLVLAQLRDTLEHLARLEPMVVFPIRAPRIELLASLLAVLLAVAVSLAPNPWLATNRSANVATGAVRDQAQRIQRAADSLPAQDAAGVQQLRDVLSKGAKTIESKSGTPSEALASLDDLLRQIDTMSAADNDSVAALSALASALASDGTARSLSSAIQSGDMQQVNRAAQDLAARVATLSATDRQRLSRALQTASAQAQATAPALSSQLAAAAASLQASASATNPTGDPASEQQAQGAVQALQNIGNDAAAIGARQQSQDQLQSSLNALERALGQSPSQRSRSTSGAPSSRSTGAPGGGDRASQTGGGQASAPGPANTSDPSAGAQSGDASAGGGYGTGTLAKADPNGTLSSDFITRLQQDFGSGAPPDQASTNAFLGPAGSGASTSRDQAVNPSFAGGTTQGGSSDTIPLGLRDLIRDYFSSVDQGQK